MTEEQKVWAQVYATILSGMLANPEMRMSWPDLRERAIIETKVALLEANKPK